MTIAVAAIVLTVVAGAVSAAGAISAGNAADASAKREATIQERNATLAQQDRVRDLQLSELERQDKARSNRRRLSAIRASYGTSGIELTGTPLELLEASSIDMALDERRIEEQGQVKARSGALRILGLQEGAETSRAAGANARKASRIQAAGTVLNTASSAASQGADL